MLTPAELRALREEKGLTQTEMAEEIGLKLRAYQDVEAGNSPIRKLHQLAVERALGYGVELSPREAEVLSLALDGKTFAEIAMVLSLSQHTVKTHLQNAREKLRKQRGGD